MLESTRDIKVIQDQLIETFAKLDDWMDKYEYLIRLGKSLAPMAAQFKTDANAVSGCQSKVWIAAEMTEGSMLFFADSDTLITKGLIGLLLSVLNSQPPEVISNTDLYFIDRIGLSTNLSPSRANGLASIVNQLKRLAAHNCKNS